MADKIDIWEGVYGSFEEAGGGSEVFGSARWVDGLTAGVAELVESLRFDWPLSSVTDTHDYILPVVVASSGPAGRKVTVLDFGGGMGSVYLSVLATVADREALEFHVVEGEAICKAARKMYAGYPSIRFHDSLPKLDSAVTIIHAGSSLHYVEDWKGLVRSFSEYNPEYFVCADLPAGDIETFVTRQNYYGKKIPVWFWNIEEFVSVVEDFGFRLIYRARYISSSELVRQAMKMENFPEKYRLGCCCQLLFRRNES